jgi:hypothetical protein
VNRTLALILVAACDSSGGTGGLDASVTTGDGQVTTGDGGPTDGSSGNELHSTLTTTCTATLQGRAIVNENGNLGIAFTEDDSPYTFLGSVQFELPDGYTGTVPDPEMWDGSSPRRVVAMTTKSYELHGNHCWFNGALPSGGSISIATYHPLQGIVKATFNALQLRSCTGAAVCTVSGTIETTGEGVFE